MPALMRIDSPELANPSSRAARIAWSTISATSVTSVVWTACTLHASASRRAVARLGVMLTIGAAGRSREARNAVDPDVV